MFVAIFQGDRIHVSVRRTLIYKFQNDIFEDKVYSFNFFSVSTNTGSYGTTCHQYKINFQFGTKVTCVGNDLVSCPKPHYTPIFVLKASGFDTDYLVDVIGILTGVGTERELNRSSSTTKLNAISIEADGYRIECTLFGNYVDELNTFISSGDVENIVIRVHFAKVFLQNCLDCTKIIYNDKSKDATELKKMMIESTDSPTQGLSQLCDSGKQNVEDEFISFIHRNTIQGLKDCKKESTFVILATIKHIVADDDWWYTTCLCGKAVYPDSKMFFCEKCNKHVIKVQQRYKLKLRVIDETNSTTFVLFDRDATTLINKSCAELFESHDKNVDSGVLPKDFDLLIDKVVLFKVGCVKYQYLRFDQSFRVKKVCIDDSTIQRFCEGRVENVDLFNKFSTEAADLQSKTIDLGSDSVLGTATELVAPRVTTDFASPAHTPDDDIPLRILRKNIKIEKGVIIP
ncbi:hypothetical protein PHAVU_005G096800 [Phaseolus vulgaris]|uniref:Replication factor A C-terminal domain-containing protein n=1 Tax=Phaseolus vulgaris TaxID=3885 RepID=V7BYS5_PHAVU|nr:hypothetical protein PHAVU_005G096800g [Phaseolus vulgaris]ESW21756.1 hypothetical protein PHAVU_005G096800g [Phaseolus vulgaris]